MTDGLASVIVYAVLAALFIVPWWRVVMATELHFRRRVQNAAAVTAILAFAFLLGKVAGALGLLGSEVGELGLF